MCWGGKIVVLASAGESPFAVSGTAHPGGLDKEDALKLTIPHIILASPGEPVEVLNAYAEIFKKAYPDRFFEMYIAEQQLVASSVGLAVRGYTPFASTFAAFFSRAYDFIRMAGISEADIRLVGSHAGCEIGADGPSQMALEDIAATRAVHTSTVLYPSDAVSTAKLVAEMADLPGISYLRTMRGAYPVIYENNESFPVGGSKVLRRSEKLPPQMCHGSAPPATISRAALRRERS